MNSEFKKIVNENETRYVLEFASSGGTGAGAVASSPSALGKMQKRSNVLAQETDDPCWDTHRQIGMKKKRGKLVPNCVPKESAHDTDELETYESAPPGFPEKLMMKLKKQYKGNPERAFATAWGIHKKKKKSVKEDTVEDHYLQELFNSLDEKLMPTDSLKTWRNTFQNANPYRYRQFKNKTRAKKDQMATSARYKSIQKTGK